MKNPGNHGLSMPYFSNQEPDKTLIKETILDDGNDGMTFSAEYFIELVKGLNPKEVFVEMTSGYYGVEYYRIVHKVEIDNPNYDKERFAYEAAKSKYVKDLAEYKKKKCAHFEKVRLYQNWLIDQKIKKEIEL